MEDGNCPITSDLVCTDTAVSTVLEEHTNEITLSMPLSVKVGGTRVSQEEMTAIVAIGKTALAADTDCIRFTAGRHETYRVSGLDHPLSKYVSIINGGTVGQTPTIELVQNVRV
jgi:hypothetical protein